MEERRLEEEVSKRKEEKLIQNTDTGKQSIDLEEEKYKVIYDYNGAEIDELSIKEGEILINISKIDENWWLGTKESNNQTGLFPATYVEKVGNAKINEKEESDDEDPMITMKNEILRLERVERESMEQKRLEEQQRLEEEKRAEEQKRLEEEKRKEEQRLEEQRLEQKRLEEIQKEKIEAERLKKEEIDRLENEAKFDKIKKDSKEDSLLTARVLYDFVAEESNEISIKEGMIVTEIEKVF
ncbi:hypothetical protein ROZALSC1DRAFT_16557 [Rozella allomycis CSF55]|uniref:SH3 domain-containing protein n=1 Tax=Rozella allomycis (strain CSF55) TaxID=988480 RepID=A0A4V1IZ92_ROZAC|nr:hypothetical protein ROZALSC1DRAFT_16557 [Rozella allomycis CSF55]